MFKYLSAETLSPWTIAAKSFVIFPLSTVSMQTRSSVWQKLTSSLLLSRFPRCSRPRVHAKIDAIGFVEVGLLLNLKF